MILSLTATADRSLCQTNDSLKTGPLADPAEEYWPARSGTLPADHLLSRLKHLSVRNGKGFISLGGSLREGYDRFNNYLWGIGPQDNDGYILHRALFHSDIRYSKNLRIFTELQSSLLTGRNGGPRPVQDLNKLDLTQLFAEYSIRTNSKTTLKLRLGEQALHYGAGSLLDLRDANVHRSFTGAKFILEKKDSRLDLFAMEMVRTNPGFFDDKPDPAQRIAGAWFAQHYHAPLNKVDLFYLYTDRKDLAFTQGNGDEKRHTIGTALSFSRSGWSAYTEAVLQLGKFNNAKIRAWKLTQTLGYQFATGLKPNLSLQSAISSGDKDAADLSLQTFSPLYARAIYYGFIDNAGASNLILVHFKTGFQPAPGMNVTGGYYRLWRQSPADGIYGPGGNIFLPAVNQKLQVGQMIDLVSAWQCSPYFGLSAIASYYNRGAFLNNNGVTGHDIWYTGASATLHF